MPSTSDSKTKQGVLPMLAAAVVLGVLLSGAVLGRLAPEAYDRLFIGSGGADEQVAQLDAQAAQQFDRLKATGVSSAALTEKLQQHLTQTFSIRAEARRERLARQAMFDGWMAALVLAVVLVMGAELAVRPGPLATRLVQARYGLIAIWIVLALARPDWLSGVGWLALLVLLAGVAAVVALPTGQGEAG